jgi:hypothetical protein
MSLIMEDDKPVKPTDISLLSTVTEMISANTDTTLSISIKTVIFHTLKDYKNDFKYHMSTLCVHCQE